jgi:GMP synthase (glutamine-hydrolysing)
MLKPFWFGKQRVMKPIAILIAGDPVPEAAALRGSFAQMIRRVAEPVYSGAWQEVDLRSAVSLPTPSDFSAVVITGSASSVTDREPWTLGGEAWLRDAAGAGTAIFGICYGHQMLGQALGGRVAKNPHGREIGTVKALLTLDDPIFGAAGAIDVNTSHVDSVIDLPSGAMILSRTDREPCAAVRFGERIWGAQFHPEFDAATVGGYIRARSAQLLAEGFDPEAALAASRDTPESARILQRFVRFATS